MGLLNHQSNHYCLNLFLAAGVSSGFSRVSVLEMTLMLLNEHGIGFMFE